MQSTEGLVGVVVPVYASSDSRLKYLSLCLKSLQRQEQPFIAVIVDDGSPRRSEVAALVSSLDSRFRFIPRERQPNDLKTASNSLNTGINILLNHDPVAINSGENVSAICYLHSDDMLSSGSLRDRLSALGNGAQFAYSKMALIDGESKLVGYQGGDRQGVLGGYRFSHHTSMWSADLLSDVREYVHAAYGQQGVFDPRVSYGEDRDVTLSSLELLRLKHQTPQYVRSPTYFYRVHNDSITGGVKKIQINHDEQLVNEKHNISSSNRALRRLVADLPWSLGAYLPERAKSKMRPIRNSVKKLITGDQKAIFSDPLLAG